jgi:Raf kinase inhibitor-like YbhB/YbcL family protein
MSKRPDWIDVATAREYLTEGRAQFVDARPDREYERSSEQLPGALHIAAGSGAAMDQLLRQIPRERMIIAYCDEPDQAASAQVARRARELGLGDASVLEGGLSAWLGADAPTTANLDAARAPDEESGRRQAGPSALPARSSRSAEAGMQVTSSSFASGQAIPAVHTAYGDNLSPPISWSEIPPDARSLVLLLEDHDARGAGDAPFAHWIVYNIQPSSSGLDFGASRDGLPAGCREGINDFGRRGYFGPRPPTGSHRYVFRLLALDATFDPEVLGAPRRAELLAALDGHIIAEARLEGTYDQSLEPQPQL